MEVIGAIIGVGLIVYGFYSMLKTGREKGLGSVILGIIGIVLLAAFF